jgi:hypothetical protein
LCLRMCVRVKCARTHTCVGVTRFRSGENELNKQLPQSVILIPTMQPLGLN